MLILLFLITLLILPAAALAGSGQISGLAWFDNDRDLIYNEGDRKLSKVTVVLYKVENGKETRIAKKTTDLDGVFSFTKLDAGDYRMNVTLPEDFQFVTPRDGGSMILPACGRISTSQVFTLGEGQQLTDLYIGASKASSYIEFYAFHDENSNGGRGTHETLLRSIEVDLLFEYKGKWIVIDTMKTTKDGYCTFWDLTPGMYRCAVRLPEPYIVGPLGAKVSSWYNTVNPADSNYGVTDTFEAPRSGSIGLAVGAIKTGDAKGTVWFDANCNGKQDKGESGYAGAKLQLVNETLGVNRTFTTTATGAYHFERLTEGTYTMTVTLPESAMYTLPGGESLITNGYTRTQSTEISVETNKTTSVKKIGVIPVTSLGIKAYNDLNANGVMDEGEPPFAGAVLDIQAGKTHITATTDVEGNLRIPILRGGAQTLQLSLPDGQVFTVSGINNHFIADTAKDSISLKTTLPHGAHTQLYAGVTLPASVSGMAFNDKDMDGVGGNGIHPDNEPGVPGITVQAVNADGVVVAETITGENGTYHFDGLLPAAHTVRFILPELYVFTEYSDMMVMHRNSIVSSDGNTGTTGEFVLTPGQQLQYGADAGVYQSAAIAGKVLISAGKAAQKLTGGLENVYVELLTEEGIPVSDAASAYTAADGSFYILAPIFPGMYRLEYTLPAGCLFTAPQIEGSTFTSEPFMLDCGAVQQMPDTSAVQSASLSGAAYYDKNLSGGFEETEGFPVSGFTVTLVNTDYDMTYETRTTENGSYSFYDLRPGAYTVTVSLDESLCLGYDASNFILPTTSQTASSAFTLLAGQAAENQNVAVLSPSSLTGTLYFDKLNNNLPDADDTGAEGITLVLQSKDAPHAYTAITDAEGHFALSSIVPGNYSLMVSLAGDCIPADGNPAVLTDGYYVSDLLIPDGSQEDVSYAVIRYSTMSGRVYSVDGTLNGVAGRTVTLYDANGKKLKETKTDANGTYSFAKLKPAEYTVACTLPNATFKFARTQDAGETGTVIARDTCVIKGLTGTSAPLYVPMGENKNDCHIGIGSLGTIGDTAWLDENKNGLQDGGEKGIPGIKIELYQYGEKAAETVTDSFGRYRINDLFPGVYTMKVTLPAEVKTAKHRTDFPKVASVLPEGQSGTAETDSITVFSGKMILDYDLGFVLKKDGKYPASMKDIPQTNWNYKKSK